MDMLAREVDAIRAEKAAADQRSVLMKVNISLAALLLRLREKRKSGFYDFGLFARIVRERFAFGQDIRALYGQLVKGRDARSSAYTRPLTSTLSGHGSYMLFIGQSRRGDFLSLQGAPRQ